MASRSPTIGESPKHRQRVEILGMQIDRLTYAETEQSLARFIARGGAHQVATVNIDFLSIGSRDPAFRALVNEADLVTADGTPVRWAARYLGSSLPARVTGPDLIDMAVRHSAAHGSSIFFLGAAPGVAAAAADALAVKHGAFHVAGIYAPPMGRLDGPEDVHIRRLLGDARPDVLFVAFGCPKQDFWIRDHRDLGVPVSAGIGGSFDYLSGRIRRAPRWAQRSGLEWAFRLAREPRRLAKRYLVDDVQVLGRIGISRFTRKQEASSQGERP
ncbi:MAG: WecB/TagA/CpsF family glycosyltransferase [Dehalococcoidia bacterium]|nr:WecB/TagA/CpsF family glycosyltransferase [Dehalococcoidia bacterium]